MPVPLHTPRINNNDDFVRVAHLYVSPGSSVRPGDAIADLETDKATFTVEAEGNCYLLRFNAQPGDSIAVGSILAWLGDAADEPLPVESSGSAPSAAAGAGGEPTLKAAILLTRYGLAASCVPAAGRRLSAADVERYVASRPSRTSATPENPSMPSEPGKTVHLTPHERGMLRTVLWQRNEAVPAYVEVVYDPGPWDEYAAVFQKQRRLLISPLLPLFAWRLARIAAGEPAINCTLATEEKYLYDHVNLGFTVQTRSSLFVIVAREAEKMDALGFVHKLGDLQRSAMRGALRPEDIAGATIGFSSMARWAVTRHVPVLLPHTALMVAHSAPIGGAASLAAAYDHRVLGGADVARILQTLASPPDRE